MLTTCGSAERAAPEQSLPGLAPGRTVPVQDTLTLWPCAVGTVTWSAASEPGTITTTSAIARMLRGTRRRARTCLPPTLAETAPRLGARRRVEERQQNRCRVGHHQLWCHIAR